MNRLFTIMLLALVTGACSSTGESAFSEGEISRLDALESQILAARWLHSGFDIETSGALAAHVKGDLWLGNEGEVRLRYKGRFQGRPVDVEIVSDGITVRHSDPRVSQRAAPLDQHQAYAIGMTRMGLMHNIAMSLSGRSPDHGMGGVRSWLTTSNLTEPEANEIAFDLAVAGTPSAQCGIIFDDEDPDKPVMRLQEVRFSETSVMRVKESYFGFSLVDTPPADLFLQ